MKIHAASLPSWRTEIQIHGYSIIDADGQWICDVPQKGYSAGAAKESEETAKLLAAVPDMWNLICQLREAGAKISDLSSTMQTFVEEANKIYGKVVLP